MSDETGIDDSTLSVVLDLRHPFSYLALGSAIQFARARGIEINWLPLTAQVLNAPSAPGPEDDRGILHRRSRAQMIAREVETYGSVQGLTLRDYYRDSDPSAVYLGWHFLRRASQEMLEAYLTEIFRGYWCGELTPGDAEAVSKIVAGVGGDAAALRIFCDGDGPPVAARAAAELSARGVTAGPGYLVQGEFFQGRQHLPMIDWILAGREGPGPI